MDYMFAKEDIDQWGISQRSVAALGSENRISDSQKE